MRNNEFNFDLNDLKWVDEFQEALVSCGIDATNVCIVGSGVLAVYGIRQNRDIDFVASLESKRQIARSLGLHSEQLKSPTKITENIELVFDQYQHLGITDEDIIFNGEYHTLHKGVKIARGELAFALRVHHPRAKDLRDILPWQQYAAQSSSWRWDLVPAFPQKPVSSESQNKSNYTVFERITRLIRSAINILRHPRWGVRRTKTALRKKIRLKRKSQIIQLLNAPDLCVRQIDIGSLLQMQFDDRHFTRYDTLLRYLTFQWYSNDKSDSFLQYEKMQKLRVNRDTTLMFKDLISSVHRRGFIRDRYPILLNNNGRLLDGSHRLACALALGVDTVPVRFENEKKRGNQNSPLDYGRSWFIESEFPEEVVTQLDETFYSILINSGAAFQMVLWPPAQAFLTDIEGDIRKKFSVISRLASVRMDDLASFVREVYASDDIARWKIEKKIYHMQNYDPLISVFSFMVPQPKYRQKSLTCSYLSTTMESLKSELRNRYKERVENYVYDILLHIGDNPMHNRQMVKAMREYGIDIGNEFRATT